MNKWNNYALLVLKDQLKVFILRVRSELERMCLRSLPSCSKLNANPVKNYLN